MTDSHVSLSPVFDGSITLVLSRREDHFTLQWTDGVVNLWTERFPTLSTALARAAVLAACGESNWEKGFTHEPEAFTADTQKFLDSQTT